MTPREKRNKRHARLRHIAHALIEGPRSILPPNKGSGWLEPDLRLIRQRPAYSGRFYESIMLFTDNTMGRDHNFLPPMLRRAYWRLPADIAALPDWPTVEISLSYFEEHRARVAADIQALQQGLQTIPFMPHGLATERNDADIETDDGLVMLKICSSNGPQEIAYTFIAMPAGDELTDLFFAVFNDLKAIMQPISRQGWREAYNWNLNELSPQKSWYWDGETPELPEDWVEQPWP